MDLPKGLQGNPSRQWVEWLGAGLRAWSWAYGGGTPPPPALYHWGSCLVPAQLPNLRSQAQHGWGLGGVGAGPAGHGCPKGFGETWSAILLLYHKHNTYPEHTVVFLVCHERDYLLVRGVWEQNLKLRNKGPHLVVTAPPMPLQVWDLAALMRPCSLPSPAPCTPAPCPSPGSSQLPWRRTLECG